MKPLGKYVVIDIAREPISKGGIFLPDNMRNDFTGYVVAVGPDASEELLDKLIAFRQGSMLCVRKNHLIIHEDNILAVLEDDE